MRIVTVNVNGVRAALKKGFEGWLATAEADTPKMDDKYAFLDAMGARMGDLLAVHERVVVLGDFNIAHTPRDLKN